MASTNDMLNAICAELKERYPALKKCEPHDGRFDLAELKRIATRAPGIFVACLGVPETVDPGTEQTDATEQFAAYIVTRDSAVLSRGKAARNIVDDLLLYLPRTRWGVNGAGIAQQIRADNLYSGAVDKKGVAMWAVSWRQTNLIGLSVWDGDGVMPTELYIGSPGTSTNNPDDYEQVQ